MSDLPPAGWAVLVSAGVTDVFFIGKEGEVWQKDELQNFYVIIPDYKILMFRVAHKSVKELMVQVLLDYLLLPTGNPFSTPAFKTKLFYKDVQLQPDVDVLTYGGNVTFILEQLNHQSNHSGLLFTCADCFEEPNTEDKPNLLMGTTRLEQFSWSHDGHRLLYSELYSKKNKWGAVQDKHQKPYGCPANQSVVTKKVVSQVTGPDLANEPKKSAAQQLISRSGRQICRVQLASDSESDHDHEQDKVGKQSVRSKSATRKPRIKNLDRSADTNANMETIKLEMEERIKSPVDWLVCKK